MKQILTISILLCSLLFTACNKTSIGIIGGSDGPTSILISEQKDKIKGEYDTGKYFREHYVDERKLPVLDMHIENPFVSEDRTLILDDSIENNLELMIYEYYRNLMSGAFLEAKQVIADGSLLAATEAYENNFKNGIYYSRIFIDEVELVDRDDLGEITSKNKQTMIDLLNDSKIKEFAIVEVEMTVEHNEKTRSLVSQVGDGEVKRYFLLGKKDEGYKIVEVYLQDFMRD